jgi:hypothetical protein
MIGNGSTLLISRNFAVANQPSIDVALKTAATNS